MIREIETAERADYQRRYVSVPPKRKRQPRQREQGKALEDIKDDAFVLSERTESCRRSDGGEERETTGRGDSREESAH